MRDDGNGRALVIDEHGALGRAIDWDAVGGGAGPLPGMQRFIPSASDTVRGFYRLDRPVRIHPNGATELVDSPAIQRLDNAARGLDTVAMMHTPPPRGATLESGTTRVLVRPRTHVRPLQVSDQWAVAADGRIAVVSVDPYRVTYFANRTRIDGPTIPYRRIGITERDKEEWLAQQREPQDVLVVPSREGPGYRTKGMAPGRHLPVEWPEYFPPFLPSAVTFAPGGSLWIQRAVSVDDSPLIDIIDDRARVTRRLTLPRRSRLVGFGKDGAVYVVRVDDDGLEFLQRYRYQG